MEPALTDEVAGASSGKATTREAAIAASMAAEDLEPDEDSDVLAVGAGAGGVGIGNSLAAGTAGQALDGGAQRTAAAGLPMPATTGPATLKASSMPAGGVGTALPRPGSAATTVETGAATDAASVDAVGGEGAAAEGGNVALADVAAANAAGASAGGGKLPSTGMSAAAGLGGTDTAAAADVPTAIIASSETLTNRAGVAVR